MRSIYLLISVLSAWWFIWLICDRPPNERGPFRFVLCLICVVLFIAGLVAFQLTSAPG